MFVVDQPELPATEPITVLLARADSGQLAIASREHVLGVCELVETHRESQPTAAFFPVLYANSSYFKVTREDVIKPETAQVRIVQQPKHGRLEMVGKTWEDGLYLPEPGYLGNDSFVVEVKGNGHTVKIKYFLRAVGGDGENVLDNKNCKSLIWKISDTAGVQGADGFGTLVAEAAKTLSGFTDLVGNSLGETSGEGPSAQITLDTNAAGYGWYVDYTPWLNEDFLPTSDPNEWIAKPGSLAEGKMDLLTVLLQEYGHAMGVDQTDLRLPQGPDRPWGDAGHTAQAAPLAARRRCLRSDPARSACGDC